MAICQYYFLVDVQKMAKVQPTSQANCEYSGLVISFNFIDPKYQMY